MTTLHLMRYGRKLYVVQFTGCSGVTLSTHRTRRIAKKWCLRNGYIPFWAGTP